VRNKGKRMGRNPKTGVDVPISPRRVLVFKASAVMKQRINGDHLKASREKSDAPDTPRSGGVTLSAVYQTAAIIYAKGSLLKQRRDFGRLFRDLPWYPT
jgi:hypothetical protein